VTDRCLGSIGPTPELSIEKFWRDQRSLTEGPTEVLRTALAKLLRGRMA
jgi:acyl-CoA dehydrogenase